MLTEADNSKYKCAGFTLIESVIAASVFIMITVLSLTMLKTTSEFSARLIRKADLLENARIGMDVILAHVRESVSVELKSDPDTGTMSELTTTVKRGNTLHHYIFTYNMNLVPEETRYHRLEFGGNELASYIADVRMAIKNEILVITIVTDEYADADAVTLRASCDLRYKEIK